MRAFAVSEHRDTSMSNLSVNGIFFLFILPSPSSSSNSFPSLSSSSRLQLPANSFTPNFVLRSRSPASNKCFIVTTLPIVPEVKSTFFSFSNVLCISDKFKTLNRIWFLFVKPRFGNVNRNGVCPPSKPNLGPPPERDFCPLCPRPAVFPLPDPMPLPFRFLYFLDPGTSRKLFKPKTPSAAMLEPGSTTMPLSESFVFLPPSSSLLLLSSDDDDDDDAK
mmetsp:Transcript_1851/g.5578  ORF Transcript_1851/g.5578 Transcript_1851/m.5578 type:complete len:220 (-) Transcript_1851:315-974(-)